MANSPSGESVIHRVVRLLSAFGGSNSGKSGRGLRELARQVDLPVSTVHRMLSELEAEGMLVKDDAGRWHHGHRLWEMASRGSRAMDVREAALGPMEDVLHGLSGMGAHVALGVMEGTDVLYIERLSPPQDDTVNITQVAGRLPGYACSPGLVLYAYGPVEQQEMLLRRRLAKLTPDTVTEPERLRALFAQIRREGYVSIPGIIVPESSGVAVPVRGGQGQVIAALSVIVPVGKENIASTLPQLAFASRAISRRLGYQPETPHLRRSLWSEPGGDHPDSIG